MRALYVREQQRKLREVNQRVQEAKGQGEFATAAVYVQEALAALTGPSVGIETSFPEIVPLPCRATVSPPGLLSFYPDTGTSPIDWVMSSPERPCLSGPSWCPPIHKVRMNRWTERSPSLERDVRSYSDLERDDMIGIEVDRNVELYCEQVDTGSIYLGGQRLSARVDRWITYKQGPECVREVKYLSDLLPSHRGYIHNVRQIVAELLFALHHCVILQVATDLWIRRNPVLLANQKILVRNAGYKSGNSRLVAIVRRMVTDHPATVGEMIAKLGEAPDRIRSTVHREIFWGRLAADGLDRTVLSDHTVIRHV